MTEQDSAQETERVDRYALDDTLAGRITQSLALGLMTSYPDWIKNKKALVAAYIGSFLGFGAGLLFVVSELEARDIAKRAA